MDDPIVGVEDEADVDWLMAGIDELLARSLAIMAQREPAAGAEPLHDGWQRQPRDMIEA